MQIGVPKEIKNGEHRVALTPDGAAQLVQDGHQVIIERNAGRGSGYEDEQYAAVGAHLTSLSAVVWDSDLVLKVKEPLPQEYAYLRPGLVLFTYLHLAAMPDLAKVLARSGVCAIGYETVQLDDGRLPLLAPMSRVAGRVAMQLAAHYLQIENDVGIPGRGVLFGGLDGVERARVAVLGGGNAGSQAASVAAAMGAEVHVLDRDAKQVERLSSMAGIHAVHADAVAIDEFVAGSDVLIGAVLAPGQRAPCLLYREHLRAMPKGAVFVDIAIDQGGCSETSRPTSYAKPVYVEESVLHCALPNLPACVARSSTQALTRATFPYVQLLANGLEQALRSSPELQRGVNVRDGQIVHAGVQAALRSG